METRLFFTAAATVALTLAGTIPAAYKLPLGACILVAWAGLVAAGLLQRHAENLAF